MCLSNPSPDVLNGIIEDVFPSPNGDVFVKSAYLLIFYFLTCGFRPLTGMCLSNAFISNRFLEGAVKFPSPNGDVFVKLCNNMKW